MRGWLLVSDPMSASYDNLFTYKGLPLGAFPSLII